MSTEHKPEVIYNKNRNGQEILDLYNEGVSCRKIAIRLKTTEPTVKSVLLQYGIVYEIEYAKKQNAKYEEALRLYQEGKPFKKICKELKIGPNFFRPYAKERLGTFRTQKESLVLNMDRSEEATLKRSQSNKRYPLNETVFDDLSREEAAYWIGFLYADGTIGKGERIYRIALGLKEGDYGHLVKYCQFFNTPKERIKYIKSTKSYQVILSSYILWKKLKDLGFNNNKSRTAIPPNELKNNRHFWRGVIDGDGCLSSYQTIDNNEIRFSVSLGGTPATIECLREFLTEELNKNFFEKSLDKRTDSFYNFQVSSTVDIENIIDLLYKDATIYLERKHLKHLEFKECFKSKQIAITLKTTEPNVKSILSKFEIVYSKEIKEEDENLKKALEFYESGMKQRQICTLLNINRNKLRPFLKEYASHYMTNGESLKFHRNYSAEAIISRGNKIRKYAIKENALDNLNSEEVQYWIGFLYAKVTIGEGGGWYRIALKLPKGDYTHLVKFCNFLQTPLERIKYAPSVESYQVTISSYRLWTTLKDLGFGYRKSWNSDPPKLIQNNKHFWRGVFDGNGYLSSYQRIDNKEMRFSVSFGGTPATIECLREFLTEELNKNFFEKSLDKRTDSFYNFQVSSTIDVENILDLLYKDATTYLERKHHKYLEFKEYFNAL